MNQQAEPGASVGRVVRTVVGAVAPEELASFDEIAAAFFDDPVRALSAERQPDEPTANGPTGLEGLITPILLAAVTGLVSDAVKQAAKEVIGAAAKRARTWFSRARGKNRVDGALLSAPVPELPPGEIEALEELVRALAKQTAVPQERVDSLCVTLRGSLSSGAGGGDRPA